MITLNDYLYSGDTVLRILQKYSSDLELEAAAAGNEIDLVHCSFLNQIKDMLEHNDFLTAQSQKIREFYMYMAKEYPFLAFFSFGQRRWMTMRRSDRQIILVMRNGRKMSALEEMRSRWENADALMKLMKEECVCRSWSLQSWMLICFRR